MPSKRKRTDDLVAEVSPSTRTTRSSNRLPTSTATSKTAAVTDKSNSKKKGESEDCETSAPPVKKTKVMQASTKSMDSSRKKSKSATKGASLSSAPDDDESRHNRTSEAAAPGSRSAPPTAKTTPPIEPYTLARSIALFKTYADEDEPTVIRPEGFEKLCNDIHIPLDGALPLVLAWQLEAKDMGKITIDEWKTGTAALKVSSLDALSLVVRDLEDLLFLDKIVPLKKQKDAYDKTSLLKYHEDRKLAFHKLYSFSFLLAKPEPSRNIDMETAAALWSVLLVPKYPLMSDVLGFISEKGTYKAANKDLWSMMLEFCETVNPNLSDYEGDGAWPTLLDDFVSWKKGLANGTNSVTD